MIFHQCPKCGAKEGEPCRSPSGRKYRTYHEGRPFSLEDADAGPCPICQKPMTMIEVATEGICASTDSAHERARNEAKRFKEEFFKIDHSPNNSNALQDFVDMLRKF